MAGATPFPFQSLSRTPGGAAGKDIAGGSPVKVHGGADDRWAALSPFGSNARERCEPECRYTTDDLTRAVDEARRKTAIDVEAELRSELEASLEHRRCDLLTAIKEQLELQRSAFDDKLTDMAVVTQSLAIALAKAVVPRAIEREPLVDIADALKATLARLVAEPSLELRLPPDLVEAGGEVFIEVAKEAGFEGSTTTTADPSLGKGDAMVCWKGGLADRRLDRLQIEALELVDRWLPVTEADGGLPRPSVEPSPDIPSDMTEQNNDNNP